MIRIDALRAKAWPIVCAVLMLFFAGTRLYNLSARPYHHDEGVNGLFMKTLIESNKWKYDPENYHGPVLYYFQLIPSWIAGYINDGGGAFNPKSLSGLTPVGIRIVVAFFGIVLLGFLLACAPWIGMVGAATACVLAGMSCDIMFISRYFIHEIYVVLFTLTLVYGVYFYKVRNDVSYAYLAAISAILMFCTKETALFHFLILMLAAACARVTAWYCGDRNEPLDLWEMAGTPKRVIQGLGEHAGVIVGICGAIWFLLFSSFLTNFRGPLDSIRTFFFWGAEGLESGHEKPFFYYITSILLPYNPVISILAVLGTLIAFIRAEGRGLFLAFWAFGMMAFYSIVPYKTPWLILNILLPMTLVAGYGVQAVVDYARQRLSKEHAMVVLTAFFGVCAFLLVGEARQTFRVNFKEYDSDRHPQIYAHTIRDINPMITKIDATAAKLGDKKLTINIFGDIYWPLPLYLIKHNALFWGSKIENARTIDAPVILVQPALRSKLDASIKDVYMIKEYLLRPGVPWLLYTNTNLAGAGSQVNNRPLDLLSSQPTPKNLKGGLKLDVFDGVAFSGKPTRTLYGDHAFDFTWLLDNQKPYKAPFSFRWTGYLEIEKAGDYRFAVESDDGSWLSIDDTPVIDNGGDHEPIKISRSVKLSEGLHKIELKYYDVLGGAVLKFTWSPPGESETVVPATVLHHVP